MADAQLEPIEIEVRTETVRALMSMNETGWIDGKVLPITHWEKLGTKEKGTSYCSKDSSNSTDDLEQARVLFEFLFVWRGVWEGRIYFKDDEYWSEELKAMSDIWDQLEPKLKEIIKQIYPHANDE